MKLSCTPVSFAHSFRNGSMDLPRFLEFCAEQKLDGVDIMASGYAWQWRDYATEIKKVRGWTEKAGLKIAAYACSTKFTVADENEFMRQIKIVEEALQDAAEIGAPVLRIFGGTHPRCGGALPPPQAMAQILRGIERCLPAAEKHKVLLALENHGGMPGHSFEIAAIIRHFRSPYLRCTFDCANFLADSMCEKENPLEAYAGLRGQIAHVHCKDLLYDHATQKMQACVAGRGVVPLQQIAARLEADGYAGYCSLEYEAAVFVPEAEGVPASLKYLKEIAETLKVLQI